MEDTSANGALNELTHLNKYTVDTFQMDFSGDELDNTVIESIPSGNLVRELKTQMQTRKGRPSNAEHLDKEIDTS